jgi:hypothetical protein
MKTFSTVLLSSCAMCLALAANAGTASRSSDAMPITNGGTGFIGVTQSAGQPNAMNTGAWTGTPQSVSRTPMAAGEASTMVNGRPNQNPDAPARGSMGDASAELRTMGNAAAMPGWQHRSWGTPD